MEEILQKLFKKEIEEMCVRIVVKQVISLLQVMMKKKATEMRGEEKRKSNANNSALDFSKAVMDPPKQKKIEIPEYNTNFSKFYNFKPSFLNLVHYNLILATGKSCFT